MLIILYKIEGQFLSPILGNILKMVPSRGPNFISFSFISHLEKVFLLSNYLLKFAFFWGLGFFYSADGGGWYTGRPFGFQKNNLYWNISKTTRQVVLINSNPNRKVFKTSLGMFRIWKIWHLSDKKFTTLFLKNHGCVELVIWSHFSTWICSAKRLIIWSKLYPPPNKNTIAHTTPNPQPPTHHSSLNWYRKYTYFHNVNFF